MKMRVLIFYFLIFFQLFSSSVCFYSFKNTYLLQDELNFAPCAILKSSPPVISGATIFSELNIQPTTTFSSLMITGWYIMRGFSTKIYTFFSVHDNGLLAALSYQPDIQKYFIQLKSSTIQQFDASMLFNEWVFIKLQVSLAPTFPSTDQINFLREKYNSPLINISSIPLPNSIGDVMSFSSSMIINIGFSDSTLGLAPSCSFFKYVTLYLDDQPFLDSSVSSIHSKRALDTYLLWHYDFVYSAINHQKLLSSGKDQDIIDAPDLSSTNPQQISPKSFFQTKSFNASENNGLIIYLEIKFNTGDLKKIVTIQQENANIYEVIFNNSNYYIQYMNGMVSSTTNVGVNLNQWYQLVIVVETINSSTVKCKIKEESSWITTSVNPEISHPFLIFGDSVNIGQPTIDNIRIYSGTFLSEDASCLLYTARKELNCLFCKIGYDLSYQNGMTCVSQNAPPTPTTRVNIQDWSHSCPLEQTYKGSPLSCSCRFGTYLSISSCLPCPTFCKGCTGPSKCDPQSFDDGYACITRIFAIPYRNNIVRFIPLPSLSPCQQCIVSSKDLQLNGSQSFFLGFYLSSTDTTNTASERVLAYIQDQGQDIFTISIKKVISFQYYICFYSFLVELKCFVTSEQNFWIGLWAYQEKALLAIGNRSLFFYETSNVMNIVYSSPILCIGFCVQTTGLMFPSVSGTFSSDFPFTFILGMKNPSDSMNEFFDLQQKPTELILSFNSMNIVKKPSKLICINQSKSTLYQMHTLEFTSLTSSKPLQGFQLTDLISAKVIQTIPGVLTNSMAMNLFIEQMTEDFIIVQFTIDGYLFKVFAIAATSYDQIFIRICVVTNLNRCLQTKYASLTKGEPNFLAMLMRDLNSELNTFYMYEFEFVCNFKRERLKFTEIQSTLRSIQIIEIPAYNNRNIYMNNLQIFQGSDFYFEYSLDDFCFLYYDLSNMQCLKAKQGYAVYNGLSVPDNECLNQISTTGAMIVYNQYTNECMQTTYVNPLCKEINDDFLSCKQCINSNADPEKQCKCRDGYFNPPGSAACIACHIKCSTCSTAFDSCNSCLHSGTTLPDCHCTNTDQYQDFKTFECKNCSNQCATCQGSPADCTLCSVDRIDPPTCGCNQRYFDISFSDTQVCTPYYCSARCETCEYSISNCITCSPGRVDPPHCNCDIGYYESGTHCLSCPSHQFYDSTQKLCLECDIHCKECWTTSKTCTDCDSDLFLVSSTCLCSDLSSFTVSASNQIVCSSGMDVSLSIEIRNSMYSLVFSFEEEISLIDFDKNPIDTILFLYIQQVPEENYFIKEAFIEGNKLIAQIQFKQSFSASSGSATFISTTQISGSSSQNNLDRKYLTTPLTFKIGPLLIADSEWQSSESLQKASTFLKNADSNVIFFIRQFSVIFYVLNTLQPSVAFLMTKIVIPPNLYQSLQIIALMIFPNVQDYSVVEMTYETNFLGFQLEKETDISENQNASFQRFGLSNNMLVNFPIALLQFLIWPIIFCILSILSSIALRSKSIPNSAKGIIFTLKQINSNNEMALLLISTACLNQFFNMNLFQYFNRISCYLAGICIMIIILLHFHNYQQLIRQGSQSNNSQDQKKKTKSKLDKKYAESEILLEMLGNLNFEQRPRIITYFFFSQILKKYLLSIFIICFQNYPIISFSGCSFIFFVSALLTAVIRPYKKHLDNIVKLIGEICLFLTWMIYLVKFIPFQRKFNQSVVIQSQDISEFLSYGSVVVIILIAYNILYLVSFIWGKVIVKIIEYLRQRKYKNEDKDSTQWESPDTQFLQYNQAYVKTNANKIQGIKKKHLPIL